jgi:Sister chromatid cohesion protein Dcc1
MLGQQKEAFSLHFASQKALPHLSAETEYLLFEVSPDLAEKFQDPNVELFIKGGDDDQAVLCTKDTTYSCRGAETSNLLMVSKVEGLDYGEPSVAYCSIPSNNPITQNINVLYSGNNFIELQKIIPCFDRLYSDLLVYKGEAEERRLFNQVLKGFDLGYWMNNMRCISRTDREIICFHTSF